MRWGTGAAIQRMVLLQRPHARDLDGCSRVLIDEPIATDCTVGYRVAMASEPAALPTPDRAALIEAALARREYSPVLRRRIEFLLDGVEDRARLRCCNSGCFVCSQQLLEILAEVEAALAR